MGNCCIALVHLAHSHPLYHHKTTSTQIIFTIRSKKAPHSFLPAAFFIEQGKLARVLPGQGVVRIRNRLSIIIREYEQDKQGKRAQTTLFGHWLG